MATNPREKIDALKDRAIIRLLAQSELHADAEYRGLFVDVAVSSAELKAEINQVLTAKGLMTQRGKSKGVAPLPTLGGLATLEIGSVKA